MSDWLDDFETVPDDEAPGPDVPNLSHWNYRVLRKDEGFPEYGVYEVYYGEDGDPIGHTENPVSFEAEEKEDLMNRLGAMKHALGKPVLSYEELEQK